MLKICGGTPGFLAKSAHSELALFALYWLVVTFPCGIVHILVMIRLRVVYGGGGWVKSYLRTRIARLVPSMRRLTHLSLVFFSSLFFSLVFFFLSLFLSSSQFYKYLSLFSRFSSLAGRSGVFLRAPSLFLSLSSLPSSRPSLLSSLLISLLLLRLSPFFFSLSLHTQRSASKPRGHQILRKILPRLRQCRLRCRQMQTEVEVGTPPCSPRLRKKRSWKAGAPECVCSRGLVPQRSPAVKRCAGRA